MSLGLGGKLVDNNGLEIREESFKKKFLYMLIVNKRLNEKWGLESILGFMMKKVRICLLIRKYLLRF